MAKARLEDRVGRRLKFRDLQVFFAVVETGSMAAGATRLGLTQPAVSGIVAQLEAMFGARLFDRSTRGVEPTVYGRALLDRARASFDEIKQGVRDIEFLTDPTSGEVHVGCAQRLSAAIMPHIVERFAHAFPRVVLHIDELPPLSRELPGLRDRRYDVILGRPLQPIVQDTFGDDVNMEVLFDDRLVVAVGTASRWAKRRKIDLADLVGERWIFTSPRFSNYWDIAEAFRLRELPLPKVGLVTSSVPVARHMLSKGEFITATSEFAARTSGLHVLPCDLGLGPWPAVILTLKNRTVSPVVERFIDCAREAIGGFTTAPRSRSG